MVRPNVRRQLGHKVVRLYGFTKLVELLVVRELAGIPSDVRKLRRVLDDLRSEYVSPWTELRWAQDQGELYWQHPDGTWSGDRRPNEMVMTGTLDLKLIRARVRESVKRDRRRSAESRLDVAYWRRSQ